MCVCMDKVVKGSHFWERIITISTLLKDIQRKKSKQTKNGRNNYYYFDSFKRYSKKKGKKNEKLTKS